MQIFAGVPREGLQLSNDSNGHGLCPSTLDVGLLIYGQYVTWPRPSTLFIASYTADRNVLHEFEW